MARKKEFHYGQELYTKGHPTLVDGTKVTVATGIIDNERVTVTTTSKHIYFISVDQLTTTAPTTPVAPKVPDWLVPIGAPKALQQVFVYNTIGINNHTMMWVTRGYIDNPQYLTCQLTLKYDDDSTVFTVAKKDVFVNKNITHIPPKPLAKNCTTLTDDHKYMIELLKEPSRAAVIKMVMDGVNLDDYTIHEGLKHYVMVPKEHDSLYLPMIMAHTDIQANVKHPTDLNLAYDEKTDMFSSPNGLGADDRAGCYAINRILKEHPKKFIIALFDEEEIGCRGSREFVDTAAFAEVNRLASCYISIDRKRGLNGAHEIATYDYDNKELFSLIETHTGRKAVHGSSTDCAVLSGKSYALPVAPGQTKLACFNMSCGYLNEHTKNEVLYFTELQQVVEDFRSIVDLVEELWDMPFEATKPVYNTYYGGNYKKQNMGKAWGDEETITIASKLYDSGDVETLLWLYKQNYGRDFLFSSASQDCKEYKVNNYIRLDPTVISGGTYAGTLCNSELHAKLKKDLWVVTKIDDKRMVLDAKSHDNKQTAKNIPYAFMHNVTVGDPLVY